MPTKIYDTLNISNNENNNIKCSNLAMKIIKIPILLQRKTVQFALPKSGIVSLLSAKISVKKKKIHTSFRKITFKNCGFFYVQAYYKFSYSKG